MFVQMQIASKDHWMQVCCLIALLVSGMGLKQSFGRIRLSKTIGDAERDYVTGDNCLSTIHSSDISS
jgi:hypothetical protein